MEKKNQCVPLTLHPLMVYCLAAFHLMKQFGAYGALQLCGHRRALCTTLRPALSLLGLLDGNFPCTGLNAWYVAHDFNFFLLPWSLGVHPVGVCVCVYESLCACVCVCWCLPLNRSVCMCVFTCLERFIAVSMQDLEASVYQVTKHE